MKKKEKKQNKSFMWEADLEDPHSIPKNLKTVQFIFNHVSESVDASCRYFIEQNQCLQ